MEHCNIYPVIVNKLDVHSYAIFTCKTGYEY